MNNLEIRADIVTNFQGLINGHIVDVSAVYHTVTKLLNKLANDLTDTIFTKQDDFISDLINTFTEIYDNCLDNESHDAYIHAENVLTNTDNIITSLDDLSDIIYNIVEDYEYTEFDTFLNRLDSNYYTK